MSRRTTRADAEAAAAQASEAARTLAARSHEVRAEEPASPSLSREDDAPVDGERIERMLKARPSIQAMDEIVKKRGR
jgi:hypothetical protein